MTSSPGAYGVTLYCLKFKGSTALPLGVGGWDGCCFH